MFVAEFYRSIWPVVDAINNLFAVNLDITDIDELQRIERGFENKSRCVALHSEIGSLDGCLILQKNPEKTLENPNRYYCARKEKISILLMEILDAQRKFLWFDMSCTQTTHDSLAWTIT